MFELLNFLYKNYYNTVKYSNELISGYYFSNIKFNKFSITKRRLNISYGFLDFQLIANIINYA